MAKFKYRLKPLLQIRETTRDERRSELAQAQRADDILHNRQTTIEQQRHELLESTRDSIRPGQVNLDHLINCQRYDRMLEGEGQMILEQRQQVGQEIERRHAILVEANRDVRILEILREKQLLRHQKEEQRQETKTLDEVAIQREYRKEADE
ncbi:MAG: flagellar export protein FliJ [Planctomycetia bacterium]|jgi:flagellar FliJ protein